MRSSEALFLWSGIKSSLGFRVNGQGGCVHLWPIISQAQS